VPLDASAGAEALGAAGAHMLDVGLSSTQRIAEFFGIAPEAAERGAQIAEATRPEPRPKPRAVAQPQPRPQPASGPQAVIEKALRAAGLMR
jgi:hypothetical protein